MRAMMIACLLPVAAQAASFDCARARQPDERAICADRALNDQDVRMEVLLGVNARFMLMGGVGAQRDDQRGWLAQRQRCGANRTCLARAYRVRVDALQKDVDAVSARVR